MSVKVLRSAIETAAVVEKYIFDGFVTFFSPE
jgi:hypothetical protein